MIAIEQKSYDARLTANRLNLDALKSRISEEKRALSVDKSRREAAMLSARAMAKELTGMRRLIAERQISKKMAEAEIQIARDRLTSATAVIAGVNKAPTPATPEGRKARVDQLAVLNKERAQIEIDLSKKVGQQRIADMRDVLKAARLASDRGKRIAQGERGRINAIADIGRLLSVDTSAMAGFNAQLATLNANFKISQATIAAQAEAAKQISNPEERKKQLGDARQAGLAAALQKARAEAQIEAKRRSAVKQTTGKLLSNQQAQSSAQKKIIGSTKALNNAYEAYLQAVDGVVMSTTQYNLSLDMADIAAKKVTGGFTGIREELVAVEDAFTEAERMAAELGAGEKTLVEIRRKSIDQQLNLFNQLLGQQTSAARSFFTSSVQYQSDLAIGLNEATGLAEMLGGSFEAFKAKAKEPGELNDLGNKLLSLPQDTRKRIQGAIDTIKVTGGNIKGFTAEELATAINSTVFGESKELKVDPLFEVQSRIAELQQEQAEIATDQLIAANDSIENAKKQVELAEQQKAMAEIQLERTQEEGNKLRGQLGQLRGTLNTTLLQQIQTVKQGAQGVMGAVARAADRMISTLPGAFSAKVADAINKSNLAAQQAGIKRPVDEAGLPSAAKRDALARRAPIDNLDIDSVAVRAIGVGINQSVTPSTVDSGNAKDTNARALVNILDEIRSINKTTAVNLGVTQEIKDGANKSMGVASGSVTGDGNVEITVNVEGTSQVTVTGFEAGVTRIAQALADAMGGFTTLGEARRIAGEVVGGIRKVLLEKQIITINTP